MDADPQCVGELLLGQPNESPKRNDIVATRNAPANDALSLLPRNRALEVSPRQFGR